MFSVCSLLVNSAILEVARKPERHEADAIIELRTEAAVLLVTHDHRVPACTGADGVFRDIEAKDRLQMGGPQEPILISSLRESQDPDQNQ